VRDPRPSGSRSSESERLEALKSEACDIQLCRVALRAIATLECTRDFPPSTWSSGPALLGTRDPVGPAAIGAPAATSQTRAGARSGLRPGQRHRPFFFIFFLRAPRAFSSGRVSPSAAGARRPPPLILVRLSQVEGLRLCRGRSLTSAGAGGRRKARGWLRGGERGPADESRAPPGRLSERSLLATRYSLLVTRYSLLATRYSRRVRREVYAGAKS
jgi:hypothetical protein